MASEFAYETLFPQDYFQSRIAFHRAVLRCGGQLETFPVVHLTDAQSAALGGSGSGVMVDDPALTIDVALWEPARRVNALVVSSGLHGVEGPLGAAVQSALLAQHLEGLGSDIGLVMMHAVNPFGFAHWRRFDQDNIDLNRNFMLPNESYEGVSPTYQRLDGLLNPPHQARWTDAFHLRAVSAILREGMPALRQAIAGGQYAFPQGLFYGGNGPGRSTQILQQAMPRWLAGYDRVVHLDFHTGLGKWGSRRCLVDYSLTDSDNSFLNAAFGSRQIECGAEGVAYEAKGGWGRWCRQAIDVADYYYLCAEFGTYGPLRVLRGLRRENCAYHWAESRSKEMDQARRQLRELFIPASPSWRRKAVANSLVLVTQAVAGLNRV